MQPLHCHMHPRVAEHQGRTNHTSKRTVGNRRRHKVLFIAGRSHFTRKNSRFRSGLLPKTSPMQYSCSNYNAFAATRTHSSSHCDLHPRVAEHQGSVTRQIERSATPAHTRGSFHRRLQPLHTEKRKLSFSGFPGTSPMQHSCSHQSAAASRGKPTCI